MEKLFDTKALLNWYKKNKRDLAWRQDKDPYKIWISEIMLQQTRIEAVREYYGRFLAEVPDVFSLAKLEPNRLKKLWQGLGYYNRAANLQKAAKIIAEKYQGVFPEEYEELLKLPGIGPYTAGAISSIAFDRKEAAVDGNVLRVFGRLWKEERDTADTSFRKELQEYLKAICPKEAGDFTSALMELGETVCLPNTIPGCDSCPIRKNCFSFRDNTQTDYPRMPKKKKAREEKRTVLLLENEGKWAIGKREEKGLLAGYDEFLNVEGHLTEKEVSSLLPDAESAEKAGTYRHQFSHIHWDCAVYVVHVTERDPRYRWLEKEEIKEKAALPAAFGYCWKVIEQKN